MNYRKNDPQIDLLEKNRVFVLKNSRLSFPVVISFFLFSTLSRCFRRHVSLSARIVFLCSLISASFACSVWVQCQQHACQRCRRRFPPLSRSCYHVSVSSIVASEGPVSPSMFPYLSICYFALAWCWVTCRLLSLLHRDSLRLVTLYGLRTTFIVIRIVRSITWLDTTLTKVAYIGMFQMCNFGILLIHFGWIFCRWRRSWQDLS